jgi:superoxide dismutase, Cu-Zn family
VRREGHIVPRCRRAVLYTFFVLVLVFLYSHSDGAFHRTVYAQSAEPGAYADIVSPVDEKLGTAKLFPVAGGVQIDLDVIQQIPGLHGVHILSVGKCEGPNFTSAGTPFDPHGEGSESANSSGPHAGDLPNVEAGLDGHLHATIVAKGVTLGDGPNSLFHPGGTAIVIDENPADSKTEGAGNSGPHIACGVIQKNGGATTP